MYRLLGMVARFGEWGSRVRGHGIAPHLVLMMLCLLGFLVGLGNHMESSLNQGEADVISQQELLKGSRRHKEFVQIQGTFLKELRLPGEDRTVYLPLLDPDSQVITYVRAADHLTVPPQGTGVKVRGMLHFVGHSLESQLPADPPGMQLNRNQYLSYGSEPASPLVALLLMIVSAPVGLLLLITFLLRYIVFRVHGRPDEAPDSEEPEGIRITGLFWGEHKESRRFLDIPGAMHDFELQATVVPQKRLPGWGQQEPAGLWVVAMEPGSLKKIQAGTLYLGFQQRPALRFSCLDRNRGKRQQVILSFVNESQRRFCWEKLTTTSSSETP